MIVNNRHPTHFKIQPAGNIVLLLTCWLAFISSSSSSSTKKILVGRLNFYIITVAVAVVQKYIHGNFSRLGKNENKNNAKIKLWVKGILPGV
jgi:hypothetical protein